MEDEKINDEMKTKSISQAGVSNFEFTQFMMVKKNQTRVIFKCKIFMIG